MYCLPMLASISSLYRTVFKYVIKLATYFHLLNCRDISLLHAVLCPCAPPTGTSLLYVVIVLLSLSHHTDYPPMATGTNNIIIRKEKGTQKTWNLYKVIQLMNALKTTIFALIVGVFIIIIIIAEPRKQV